MEFCRYLLVSVLALGLAFSVQAQSEKKLIKEAENAYQEGDKLMALDYYLKAHQRVPDNAEVNYQIGKIYLETIHKQKSLPYLQKAYEENKKLEKIELLLGVSYHYNHMWDEAIGHYETYRSQVKEPGDIEVVDRKIYECNNGKEFVTNPVEVRIENAGPVINTKWPEYAPIVSADESILIFTSRREGSTGGLIDVEGDFYEDIYISEKIGKEWSNPRSISALINTNYHDASIGLSPDGKQLFLYKDEGNGDIFTCNMKKDGTWSKPRPMEDQINTKKFYENSAAITPDGKKLFFTSNRDGGQGDLDIWYVEMQGNGKWSDPKNLGPVVNTKGAEEAPFLDLDGKTLYFSSNMHKGMGDFDIFKTIYDAATGTWSEPENLGWPINSADEDLYFTLSGDGRHAYFASAKEDGKGEKDIYKITMPPRHDYEELVTKVEMISGKTIEREKVEPEPEPEPEPQPEPEPEQIVLQPVIIKGVVTDVASGQPLQASIEIVDAANKTLYTVTTGEDGQYLFHLPFQEAAKVKVSAEKNGFGFNSKNVPTPAPGPEEEVLIVDLALKKLDVGNKFILRNIYFDFDQATITPESKPELDKLLKLLNDNPNLKIELGGHTDFIGSNQYNKALSQKRADAVRKYLINNGISADRITAVGYGEERPLASNDDETEGRELNRRTEFEVKGN